MTSRRWVGVTLAVVFAALSAASAWAGEGALRCRSDPAVLLSNGAVVDISADIAALPWDVVAVDYTMRVPAGLRVVATIRTPSWPTTKETFNVVADQPPGVYDTTTTVRTRNAGVPVTASLLVKTLTNLLDLRKKDGKSGEPIQLSAVVR